MRLIKPKKSEKSRKVVKKVEKVEKTAENRVLDPFTLKMDISGDPLPTMRRIGDALEDLALLYLLSGEG